MQFKIIRSLLYSKKSLHLRSFVNIYGFSPAGTAAALHRLEELGVLKVFKEKNRKCYSLNIEKEEEEVLMKLYEVRDKNFLEERAAKFSKNAMQKLENMDEMYKFYREVNKSRIAKEESKE